MEQDVLVWWLPLQTILSALSELPTMQKLVVSYQKCIFMFACIIQQYRMKCGIQNIAYVLDIYGAVQSPPVGVRMLDGDMTDMVEAQSLSLRQQYIDIYSSSWGPDDDGRTVDGPGPLARLALESGIRKVSVCLCGYVHYWVEFE